MYTQSWKLVRSFFTSSSLPQSGTNWGMGRASLRRPLSGVVHKEPEPGLFLKSGSFLSLSLNLLGQHLWNLKTFFWDFHLVWISLSLDAPGRWFSEKQLLTKPPGIPCLEMRKGFETSLNIFTGFWRREPVRNILAFKNYPNRIASGYLTFEADIGRWVTHWLWSILMSVPTPFLFNPTTRIPISSPRTIPSLHCCVGHTAWAPEGREGRYQAGPKGPKPARRAAT